MRPASGSPNLPRFKEDFKKFGRYLLLPIISTSGTSEGPMTPNFDVAIEKWAIQFLEVEKLTKNDSEYAVVKTDELPEL